MREPIVPKENRLFGERSARQRILSLLFASPGREFSLSELAAASHVAKTSASREIGKLRPEGIVKISEGRREWRISANTGSKAYKREKMLHNLGLVCRSGAIEFLADRFNAPKAIVLFGSFRKGEDIEGSDIDIAVETGEPGELKELGFAELKPLEEAANRRARIYEFSRKKIDVNLFNGIANGIVLYGFLEVRP